MAVSLKGRIRHLFPEFLTYTLVVLGTVQAARAVSAGALQPLTDGLYHFCIFIQPDCHICTSFVVLREGRCPSLVVYSSFFSKREYPFPYWTQRETRLSVAEDISTCSIT